MKFKTTDKEIRRNYNTIIRLGYCSIQSLLNYKTPIAYTCGVYGWKADFYEISPTVIISTGYSPIGNISPNYDVVNSYEKQAQTILYGKMEYEDKKTALDKLLREFVAEIIK